MSAGDRDGRPEAARELHKAARTSDSLSREYRDGRDRIVRELRAEDPDRWTLSELAREVGCSKELVAHILRQHDGRLAQGERAPA